MDQKTHYPEAIQENVFRTLSQAAEELELPAYVIGGYVRDFFLKRGQKKDIDVVAIGSGISLARKVEELLPQSTKVSIFKNFGTAMVKTDAVTYIHLRAHETGRKPVCRPLLEKKILLTVLTFYSSI